MAHIRFSIQVDTEDEEPSRVVRRIEGTVYEYEGESDTEKQIGDLRCFLVQPGLAEEKQIHLFDAMDSINDETAECYEAVFDPATNDWNADIEDLYAGGPVGVDLLFIEQIRLNERHRGKGIGRNVVREIIETFGLQCGLVVCKPFPLEYSGWAEKYSAAQQAEPDFDRKKTVAFEGVRLFWQKCGFIQLPGSDFFAHCPGLLRQPDLDARKTSPVRVARGRRRLIRGRNR